MKKEFTPQQLHDKREDALLRQLGSDSSGVVRGQLVISRQLWRDNGRWNRYFQAREGRVHASRYCPTLTDTTSITALWQFSGEDIDVVADAGKLLCLKCFPEAPRGRRKSAAVCEGSGQRSRCRCGGRGCRQLCAYCGQTVLVTPSNLLRRHG